MVQSSGCHIRNIKGGISHLGVANVGGQNPNDQHLGNLYYTKGGVNYGQLNAMSGFVIIYDTEDASNYLIIAYTRGANWDAAPHYAAVLASNVLSLGNANNQGTQEIYGGSGSYDIRYLNFR